MLKPVPSITQCAINNTHKPEILVPQVGPGVKELGEGDVVLPLVPLLGCWAEAAVVKAKSVVRVGKLATGGAAHSTVPDAADAKPGEDYTAVRTVWMTGGS
jgi:hypothetical protein